MENTKYLTEERYEKAKKKIIRTSLIMFIFGLLIGGGLIGIGVKRSIDINYKYSQKNKEKVSKELEEEKQNVETSKKELEEKIKPVEDQIKSLERVPFTGFDDAYYERKDQIEELKKSIKEDNDNIDLIEYSLNDIWCGTEKSKNNSYTSKYCDLKNQLDSLNDNKKSFESMDSIPFYIIGAFIILASVMISSSIYMFGKGREIAAFATQQGMPVAKETIDEITPTVANAAGTIAKEISKGINSNKE